MDEVIGIVLVHLDFFEDDAALLCDISGIEHWMQDEIGQHVHGNRKVFIQHFNVETNAFLGGEGVHVAADRIDLASDGFGGACLGALEHHVLDEMRDAIPFGVFVARS